MYQNAANGIMPFQNTVIDYIRFGRGDRNLIMIPGLGDGFKTARGMALPFAFLYRSLAKDYTVYYFSRRRTLPQGFTTRDMAEDLYACLRQLRIRSTNVFGVSEGGMIAQHLAADHPEMVEKLVLAVTVPFANDTVRESIQQWIAMAEQDNYAGIYLDTAERSYTEAYLKKTRLMNLAMSVLSKPSSMENFMIQANACLSHNAADSLKNIKAETLIIGAAKDRVVGVEGSYQLHEGIAGSELYVYPDYSHGVYEEAPDFVERIMSFLKEEK